MSSSAISGMSIAASALSAFADGMNVHAHNIANINTDGFVPHSATYQTGPQGEGVQVHLITPPSETTVQDANATANAASAANLNPSQTELPVDFTNMIITQNAFDANAVTITTWDEMLGNVIDMKL